MSNFGGLPPIDLGGWADYQRKRLQQEAQQRIAAAGATASDWVSQANQRVEQIGAGIGALSQRATDAATTSAGTNAIGDWASRAGQTIEGIGADVSEGAQNVAGQFGAGFAGASAAPRPANMFTPGQYQPETPWQAAGGVANQLQRSLTDPTIEAINRVQASSSGAAGGLRGLGVPEGLANVAGFAAGAMDVPGAIGGANYAEQLRGAGATPGQAQFGGDIAETVTPVPLGGPDALTKLRAAGMLGGTLAGGAIGYAMAPENEKLQGTIKGAVTGGSVGPDVFALAGGVPGAIRSVPGVAQRVIGGVADLPYRFGTAADAALGAVRLPRGPGALPQLSQEALDQRIASAQNVVRTWGAGQFPEKDYLPGLIEQTAVGPIAKGKTDWAGLFRGGHLDPDALNTALQAYKEQGLSVPNAARAGGVSQSALGQAIEDLASYNPLTGKGEPFQHTANERGAIKAERNAPSPPGTEKPNYEYVDKGGRTWYFGTPYEVLFARQLDANPNVAYWQQSLPEGRMKLKTRFGGDDVVFSPDFLVVGRNGRSEVVEIKNIGAFRQPAWRVPEKLRAAENYFAERGMGFRIFVEDQLGRMALKNLTVDDLAPDARGLNGIADQTQRERLIGDLQDASRAWELHPVGRLSGAHAATPEEWADIVRTRMYKGEPVDEEKLAKMRGPGYMDPATGGYGAEFGEHSVLPPSQGGYNVNWTPHRAYAEFNARQLARTGTPGPISRDAVEHFPTRLPQAQAMYDGMQVRAQAGHEGMTFNPSRGDVSAAPHYVVSVMPDFEDVVPGRPEDIHPDRLAMFMAERDQVLRLFPDVHVGAWYDSTNNRTFLDLSVTTDSEAEALRLGRQMGQHAIYDGFRQRTVPIDWSDVRPETAGRRWTPPRPGEAEQQDALRAFSQRAGATDPGGASGAVAGAGAGTDQPNGPLAGMVGQDRSGAVGGLSGSPGIIQRGADPGAGRPGLGGLATGVGDTTGPGSPGSTSFAGVDRSVRDRLGSALEAAVSPTGAAVTQGQRRFDLASTAIGGVAGAATGPEDQTWQERAKRGVLGASAGALAGPSLRSGLGLMQGEGDVLGAASRRARARSRTVQAAAPQRGLGVSDIPQIMGALPLAAPSSLAVNLISGSARTLERIAGKVVEGRPLEALIDVGAMAKAFPGAAGKVWESAKRGPTMQAPGVTGAPLKTDLAARAGKIPAALSSGIRANSATDQFWRDLNEAGATAVAKRRGLSPAETQKFVTSTGDFATFGGPNTIVARSLTKMKQQLADPTAPFADRAIGGVVTTMAPYVMMPERLLRSTLGALIPVESTTKALEAFLKGDKVAARELAGRAGAGMLATYAMVQMYNHGTLTGPAPQDPNERRRREAQGAVWNTIKTPAGNIPTKFLGSVGMQASAVASILDAVKAREAKGESGADLWDAAGNELMGWSLDNSYLSDLSKLGGKIHDRKFTDAATDVLAGVPSRFTSFGTGMVNAADPYEREPQGLLGKTANRTGLRFTQPTRIDPTTGEDQRRAGSGFSRYFGEQGDVQTDAASELARLELQPSVIDINEQYKKAAQTPEQRRLLQRVLGSETGKAVRETMATSEYQAAHDDTKKTMLQAALRTAASEADIRAGAGVARDPKNTALREWQAIPKYRGVDGTPDEIRRLNAQVARAKSALSAARSKGRDAEAEWKDRNPALYELANYRDADPRTLKQEKDDIEQKYKVKLD